MIHIFTETINRLTCINESGWFLTQDIGVILDGKLKVIGRADDVIISGGENISLSAIESELNKKFPQLLVAAFATSDSKWGQALHVAVQTQDENIKPQTEIMQNQRA